MSYKLLVKNGVMPKHITLEKFHSAFMEVEHTAIYSFFDLAFDISSYEEVEKYIKENRTKKLA